jgi:hypothetical protein
MLRVPNCLGNLLTIFFCNPILFATCTSTFSKLCKKNYAMVCRRQMAVKLLASHLDRALLSKFFFVSVSGTHLCQTLDGPQGSRLHNTHLTGSHSDQEPQSGARFNVHSDFTTTVENGFCGLFGCQRRRPQPLRSLSQCICCFITELHDTEAPSDTLKASY